MYVYPLCFTKSSCFNTLRRQLCEFLLAIYKSLWWHLRSVFKAALEASFYSKKTQSADTLPRPQLNTKHSHSTDKPSSTVKCERAAIYRHCLLSSPCENGPRDILLHLLYGQTTGVSSSPFCSGNLLWWLTSHLNYHPSSPAELTGWGRFSLPWFNNASWTWTK